MPLVTTARSSYTRDAAKQAGRLVFFMKANTKLIGFVFKEFLSHTASLNPCDAHPTRNKYNIFAAELFVPQLPLPNKIVLYALLAKRLERHQVKRHALL